MLPRSSAEDEHTLVPDDDDLRQHIKIISHIFRDQRPRGAHGGAWLHAPETINGA